jgi:hypothetical protein
LHFGEGELVKEEFMELKATIEIWKKGKWYIARIPELDFVAQGRNLEEAKANLLEVARIQFAEMKEMGTLDEYLGECGFIRVGENIEPQHEIVGFEQHWLQVA